MSDVRVGTSPPEECFDDEFYMWLHFAHNPDGSETFPTWQHPCVRAMTEDLGLVRETCHGYPQWLDDSDYVRGCGGELLATLLLAIADFGLIDELEAGPSEYSDYHDTYVHPPLIDELHLVADILGHDEVGPALYDMVTSTLTAVVYQETPIEEVEATASIDLDTRVLTLYHNPGSELLMATFVHEAAHAWLDRRHVTCTKDFQPCYMCPTVPAGVQDCDESWDGAWGFGGGAAFLALEHALESGRLMPYLSTTNLWNFATLSRCYINSEDCPD